MRLEVRKFSDHVICRRSYAKLAVSEPLGLILLGPILRYFGGSAVGRVLVVRHRDVVETQVSYREVGIYPFLASEAGH